MHLSYLEGVPQHQHQHSPFSTNNRIYKQIKITQIRKHFDIPLCVGFGLSQPHHYQGVQKLAEGAVVGSSIIKAIEEGKTTEERCAKVSAFCHNFLSTTPAAVADK